MPEQNREIILLVEDDVGVAELICEKLGENGHTIAHSQNGQAARSWLGHNHPRLILLDYSLPDMSGEEFVKQTGDMPPFIVTTGAGDEEIAVTMMKHGARDYLVKDFRFLDNLPLVVEHTLKEIATERSLAQAEDALKTSQARYRLLFEKAPIGILSFDTNSVITSCNDCLAEIIGVPIEKLIGVNILATTHDNRQKTALQEALDGRTGVFEGEYTFITGGQTHFIRSTYTPFLNADGAVEGGMCMTEDISERVRTEAIRQQAEKSLRESELNYRTLANSGQALIWSAGPDALCNYFNKTWLEFTGRTLEQEMGNGWVERVHPDDFQRCLKTYLDAFERRQPFSMAYRLQHRDGEYRWLQDDGSPRYNSAGEFIGYLGYCLDITARKQAEEALRASLAEKEVLLKEVHHRVKNNLASISALINLQQEQLTDPSAITEFADLSRRIQSMALVHELLYQNETLSQIDMQDYLDILVTRLYASYRPQADIHLNIDAYPVTLDLDHAIPCGLIVNELVTNAFKYAFPEGKPRPGETACQITVQANWDGEAYTLTVYDNGVGLPANLDWMQTQSLGMQLVMILSQRQLNGHIELDRSNGTTFRLRFMAKDHRGK